MYRWFDIPAVIVGGIYPKKSPDNSYYRVI